MRRRRTNLDLGPLRMSASTSCGRSDRRCSEGSEAARLSDHRKRPPAAFAVSLSAAARRHHTGRSQQLRSQ